MYKLITLSIFTAMALLITAGTASADENSHNKGKMMSSSNDMSKKMSSASKNDNPKVEGMLLPYMSPSKGRLLYASKGCVVCHSINGIGGEDAPALDAKTMTPIMDPFDFAAKMWRGAGTMITMQEDELGEQIDFTGEELANIIAFVHSASEQKKFSKADIPPRIIKLMAHLPNESEEHEKKEHDD
jgi:cytochrome c